MKNKYFVILIIGYMFFIGLSLGAIFGIYVYFNYSYPNDELFIYGTGFGINCIVFLFSMFSLCVTISHKIKGSSNEK